MNIMGRPIDDLHHRAKATGWWLEVDTGRQIPGRAARLTKLAVRDQTSLARIVAPLPTGHDRHVQAAATAILRALAERDQQAAA